MTSIFENTKNKVTIHIIHDDNLDEDNKQKLIRTAQKYSQGLNLVNVSKNAEGFSDELKEAAGRWTVGLIYKFLALDVLPELQKVIYLDCDIIVNLDISELWNADIDDKSFGAVLDEVPETLKAYSIRNLQLRLININRKFYINSGVLVMNLQKIRSQYNTLKPIFDWFARYAHLLPYVDQDLINHYTKVHTRDT